jgi:hypothetical protein
VWTETEFALYYDKSINNQSFWFSLILSYCYLLEVSDFKTSNLKTGEMQDWKLRKIVMCPYSNRLNNYNFCKVINAYYAFEKYKHKLADLVIRTMVPFLQTIDLWRTAQDRSICHLVWIFGPIGKGANKSAGYTSELSEFECDSMQFTRRKTNG